jgi:type I restriction enzyme M protein
LIEFRWYPGLAISQKQRSIVDLHDAARRAGLVTRPLEISSKSPDDAGRRLSAFNLQFHREGWPEVPVELAFQSSKVFAHGGPYLDLLAMSSRDAKRDPRLRASGNLVFFTFNGENWPIVPTTLFYDWLYINALSQNSNLAATVLEHDGFTDIEFNPERSLNCQARSAALFVSLERHGLLARALEGPSKYQGIVAAWRSAVRPAVQGSLL